MPLSSRQPRKRRSTRPVKASSHTLDRLRVRFDAKGLVANAGLVLPATLAQRLGLPELLRHHIRLGKVAVAANPDRKAMTVIGSLLAGGEWMEDVNALRAGGLGTQILGACCRRRPRRRAPSCGRSPLATLASWTRSRRISTGAPGRREPDPASRR